MKSRIHPATKVAFAAALVAGMSAATAFAQGTYGTDSNSPLNLASPSDEDTKALRYIEVKLQALDPSATLQIPISGLETIPSATELATAIANAVEDEIDGTDDGAGDADDTQVTLASLIRAGSLYKTGGIASALGLVATKIINQPQPGDIAADLETAVSTAVTADTTKAAAVTSSVLKVLAASPTASQFSDDVAADAIASARLLADKVVSSAVGAVAKSATKANDIYSIATAVVSETAKPGSRHLLEEVTKALITSNKGNFVHATTPVDLTALTVATLTGLTPSVTDKNDAGLRAAVSGILAGLATNKTHAGAATIQPIAAEYASNNALNANAINVMVDTFEALPITTDKLVFGPAYESFLNSNNATVVDEVAASLAGAISLYPASAPAILLDQALKYDAGFGAFTGKGGGNDTLQEIVQSATRTAQKSAVALAKQAVLTQALIGGATLNPAGTAIVSGTVPSAELGAITTGIIAEADVSIYGSAVSTLIKTGGSASLSPNGLTVVESAVTTAFNVGNRGAFGEISKQASLAAKSAINIVTKAIDTAELLAVSPSDVANIAVGAVAADKKNAQLVKDAALAAAEAAADVAIVNGADVAIALQTNPKQVFNLPLIALRSGLNVNEESTLAIIYGAGIINNKLAPALAAAAIAETPHNSAAIIEAATQTSRKLAPNIQFAAQAAGIAKNTPNELYDRIEHLTLQQAKYASDIALGATIALPTQAHVIGHATVFRAPSQGAKIASALFLYTLRDTDGTFGAAATKTTAAIPGTDDNITDPVAAAAAISAGLTCGIVEAKSGTKELGYLKATIVSAVKAALFFPGTNAPLVGATIAQSDGTNGGSTMAPSLGSAGVITGYVAQAIAPGSTNTNATIDAVINAAVKSAKKHGLEIAQAAGQAIGAVVTVPNIAGFNITNLVSQIFSAGAQTSTGVALTSMQIQNAITFGFNQAKASIGGAGYLGVSKTGFYSHHTCTGDPVTGIFDL